MRRISLILLAMVLPLAGCGISLPSPEEPDPQVLFIALDGTGSYEHMKEAKRAAIRALEKAPAKSKVYVRWITGNSAADGAAIASAYLPEKADNPYQSENKKRSTKQRLAQAIAKTKSPEAQNTDLEGLLWTAERRFRGESDKDLRLILATDLAGNAGREFPEVNLSGVTVRVVGFEVDPSRPKRESRWRKTFQEAGADTTVVRYLDEPPAPTD